MYKLFILGSLVWGSFLGSFSCSDQLFIRNHGLVVNFAHVCGFCFACFIWSSCYFKKVAAIPYQHGGPSLAKNSPELLWQTQGSGHGTVVCWWPWQWEYFGRQFQHTLGRVCSWILDPNPVFTGIRMGETIMRIKEAHLRISDQRGIWNRARDRSQGPFSTEQWSLS